MVMALALGWSSAARAELSGTFTFRTDDRFRGHSLSQGRPILSLGVSYDHSSGLFLDVLATGVVSPHDGPELLVLQENLGIARQLTPKLSVDLGMTNSDYSKYYNGFRSAHYQEFYIGLSRNSLSAHLHYSPRYFGLPFATLYGEIDAMVPFATNWRAIGHVGLLHQISGATFESSGRTHYDWRLGAATRRGPFDLDLEMSGGGPGRDYYGDHGHNRTALVFGITFAF